MAKKKTEKKEKVIKAYRNGVLFYTEKTIEDFAKYYLAKHLIERSIETGINYNGFIFVEEEK